MRASVAFVRGEHCQLPFVQLVAQKILHEIGSAPSDARLRRIESIATWPSYFSSKWIYRITGIIG